MRARERVRQVIVGWRERKLSKYVEYDRSLETSVKRSCSVSRLSNFSATIAHQMFQEIPANSSESVVIDLDRACKVAVVQKINGEVKRMAEWKEILCILPTFAGGRYGVSIVAF